MNNETALECVQLVAATLTSRAQREVDKLVEKLSSAPFERLCHILLRGSGKYGGILYLSRTYGTEATEAAYAAALIATRQCLNDGE